MIILFFSLLVTNNQKIPCSLLNFNWVITFYKKNKKISINKTYNNCSMIACNTSTSINRKTVIILSNSKSTAQKEIMYNANNNEEWFKRLEI